MSESTEAPITTEKEKKEPLLGEVLMTRGDETGEYWRQHFVYPTPQEVQDIDYLRKEAENAKGTKNSQLREAGMRLVSSPDLQKQIGEAFKIGTKTDIEIFPIKAGNYEIVHIAVIGGKPTILTIPNRNQSIFTGNSTELFLQNQHAMKKSWNSLPGVCPEIYYTSENTGTEMSIMELIGDHEEMNLNALSTHNEDYPDERIPIPQFLTRSTLFELANGTMKAFPKETKQLFTAYVMAKLVALRSLMTLSTLEPSTGGRYKMAMPRSLSFGAGDPVVKINNKRQLEMRAIAFNRGTREVFQVDDLIESILDQNDGIYLAEDVRGRSDWGRKNDIISQIPHFLGREQWVKSIVQWMAQGILDAKNGDTGYITGLEGILKQSNMFPLEDIKKATSPFTIESLQSVSQHFGTSMLGDRTKRVQPEIQSLDDKPRINLSDIHVIRDDD